MDYHPQDRSYSSSLSCSISRSSNHTNNRSFIRFISRSFNRVLPLSSLSPLLQPTSCRSAHSFNRFSRSFNRLLSRSVSRFKPILLLLPPLCAYLKLHE